LSAGLQSSQPRANGGRSHERSGTTPNPQLKDLVSHKPGKPIEELARERGLKPSDIIKMASNEEPAGSIAQAVEAMTKALQQAAHLSGWPAAYRLREAIAEQVWHQHGPGDAGQWFPMRFIEFVGHAFSEALVDNVITRNTPLCGLQTVATSSGADYH